MEEKHNQESFRAQNSNNKHSYFLRAKGARASQPTKEIVPGKNKPTTDHRALTEEDEYLASCLVMLSNKDQNGPHRSSEKGLVFQCKECKKMFASHQALGGHRASHKKVKGCFASGPELEEDSGRDEPGPSVLARTMNKTKVHECSVCFRVFASGQALGGHKRCHWLTSSAENAYSIPSFQELRYDEHDHQKPVYVPAPDRDLQLDLNLSLSDREIEGRDGLETKKLRRLSDLPDVNYVEGWLQMGIASAAEF